MRLACSTHEYDVNVREHEMLVSEILKLKGSTLYAAAPETPLGEAVATMADLDIGSLVVMAQGELVGMLTQTPRVVWSMVKSGDVTEKVLLETASALNRPRNYAAPGSAPSPRRRRSA